VKIEIDLSTDFSECGQALVVQKLPVDTALPCRAVRDTCPLPANWVVWPPGDAGQLSGLVAIACHEHMPGMLWDFCSPEENQ